MNLVEQWMAEKGISKADYVDVPLELVDEFFNNNPGLLNPEFLTVNLYGNYFHSAAVVDGFVHCPWFNEILQPVLFVECYFPGQSYTVEKWE